LFANHVIGVACFAFSELFSTFNASNDSPKEDEKAMVSIQHVSLPTLRADTSRHALADSMSSTIKLGCVIAEQLSFPPDCRTSDISFAAAGAFVAMMRTSVDHGVYVQLPFVLTRIIISHLL
jgi:hypothetical protein